jgi:hypothetical protein
MSFVPSKVKEVEAEQLIGASHYYSTLYRPIGDPGGDMNSRSFKTRIDGHIKTKNRQGDAKAALLDEDRKLCIN